MHAAYVCIQSFHGIFPNQISGPEEESNFSKLICSETFTYTYMIDFSSWQNHKQLQLMALIMVFLRTHVANRKLTHPSTKILGTSFKKNQIEHDQMVVHITNRQIEHNITYTYH